MTDPDDTLPDNEPPDCEDEATETERRIAALETERRTASFGRAQQIGGELEELYIRRGYERTGKVAL